MDGDGNYRSNLSLPVNVVISGALQAPTFLVHCSFDKYSMVEKCMTVYKFALEIVNDRQTLKIFNTEFERKDASSLGFAEDDTFQFVRAPPKISIIRDAYDESQTTWPTTACQPIHQLYDTLGDRVVGATATVSDPVLCGPLSIYPEYKIARPFNSGARFLPDSLGTYELEYIIQDEFPMTLPLWKEGDPVHTFSRVPGSKMQLVCEYLKSPLDQIEKLYFGAPLTKKVSVPSPALGKVETFQLSHGRPEFILIEHDGLREFSFFYRDDPCPVLEVADRFSLYKMFNRCIPVRNVTKFEDWVKDGCPFLIRWEELGMWRTVTEQQERFILEFVPRAGTFTKIDVTFIYENHFLISDKERGSKFTFV